MVHPRNIFRDDPAAEDAASTFTAPVNALSTQPDLDCGLSAFPALSSRLNLEKFAKPSVYVALLSSVAFFQGTVTSYFRSTSHIWKEHYNFEVDTTGWLIYADDFSAGLVAIAVAYWGNKIHRISWLGSIIIFHAISAALLIVPELHLPEYEQELINNGTDTLCLSESITHMNKSRLQFPEEVNEVAMGVFVLYQLCTALLNVSFLTHAITYLDDNVKLKLSIGYISLVYLFKMIGQQIGMYVSWVPVSGMVRNIFFSPVWLTLVTILFILGILISMFPKSLPSAMLKTAVSSILDFVNGVENAPAQPKNDEDFATVFIQCISNKTLMLLAGCIALMYASTKNFELLQDDFYQSKFYMPRNDLSGYQSPWLGQIITNLLRQPFSALCIVTTGIVLVKLRPKARYLAMWNALVIMLVAIFYFAYMMFQCIEKIQTEFGSRISIPFCSSTCSCPGDTVFAPVCTTQGQKTYFSPCHAGCSSVEEINDVRIYGNCTCGSDVHVTTDTKATEGACNSNCQIYYGITQANEVLTSGLLSSVFITTLLLSLRTVPKDHKAVALSLVITLTSILPYFPVRILYNYVSKRFCRFYDSTKRSCIMHAESFGYFLPATTGCLLCVSGLLAILVIKSVAKLELYKLSKTEDESLEQLRRRDRLESESDCSFTTPDDCSDDSITDERLDFSLRNEKVEGKESKLGENNAQVNDKKHKLGENGEKESDVTDSMLESNF